MNIYLLAVILLLVGDYLLNFIVEKKNLHHFSKEIPEGFRDLYDRDKYVRSQEYLIENTCFDLLSGGAILPLMILFIILGGFGWVDGVARAGDYGMIPTGLIFAGICIALSQLLHLPVSVYATFVIEEKFGFNKTTVKTFIADWLKSLVLTILIGGLLFAAVLWFFSRAGSAAWLYAWLAVTLVQFIIIYLAPVLIMPLFNKFIPLEDGELKDEINAFAEKEGFSISGVFKTDGSRRSTKANAYFTGFGRWRRIVLYDTLIEKHTVKELVSVLAHEIGHYKLKHIQQQLIISVASTGLMFYILSLFLHQQGLYEAFGVSYQSINGAAPIYAGMIFFGFLYTPISMILSIIHNIYSRKHEYEADAYAVTKAGDPDSFIHALKNLSVDTLSNLNPHPMKVFMEYSHPPVLRRIAAIQQVSLSQASTEG